jgi:hypothetical protein
MNLTRKYQLEKQNNGISKKIMPDANTALNNKIIEQVLNLNYLGYRPDCYQNENANIKLHKFQRKYEQ